MYSVFFIVGWVLIAFFLLLVVSMDERKHQKHIKRQLIAQANRDRSQDWERYRGGKSK